MYRQSEQIENRLQTLIQLIREGKYSTPKLATALNLSPPTISRCLTALRQRGYSIRAVNDGGNWSYELAGEPGKSNGKKGCTS